MRALVVLGLLASLVACSSLQKAAREDPMKCERDAKCDKKRTRTHDCSTQCVDDPACMSRCEQVQAPNGGLGH
ncbi:MAG TPA: hypothetical protein VLT33_40850 [Labilithrix sp.]|nr:hypothetical protein [Labilithrix sp.]